MTDRNSLEALFWKTLLVGGALWILYLCLDIVLLAVISVVVAAAILPIADNLQRKRRVPRGVTLAAVYIIGLGVLVLLVALLVPLVVEQGQTLAQRLPEFQQKLNDWLARDPLGLTRFTRGRPISLPTFGIEQLGPLAQTLLQRSVLVTRGLFTGVFALVLVLFVAGYIVVDQKRIANGLLTFVPASRRDRVGEIADDVLRRMGGYMRGQVIVSLCVAAFLTIGLALVGFDSPLLIGVLAGALNFIPYLGSTVAWLLALLLAISSGLYTVIGVIAVFSVEQFVEGHFLVPYFTGKQVELHPLAVFAALIVGATLAGLLGALVAVPVAAGIDAILQETYVKACQADRSRRKD